MIQQHILGLCHCPVSRGHKLTLTGPLIYISKHSPTTRTVVECKEDLRTEARGFRWISVSKATAHQNVADDV